MGCYLCQNDYDNVHTRAFICTLQYACQHAYARYNHVHMHINMHMHMQYACQHAYARYNMHAICICTLQYACNMHVNIIIITIIIHITTCMSTSLQHA